MFKIWDGRSYIAEEKLTKFALKYNLKDDKELYEAFNHAAHTYFENKKTLDNAPSPKVTKLSLLKVQTQTAKLLKSLQNLTPHENYRLWDHDQKSSDDIHNSLFALQGILENSIPNVPVSAGGRKEPKHIVNLVHNVKLYWTNTLKRKFTFEFKVKK